MTAKAPPFFSPYAHDFLRLAVCVPRIEPAAPRFNADRTLELVKAGDAQRVGLMVFPELGLSAYAIDDLLFQDALLDAVEVEIARLAEASASLYPVFAVGAPLRVDGRLYNTAVVIGGGRILGVTPKVFLPNYREFYERRWFTSGQGVVGRTIPLAGQAVPFGTDLIYRSSGTVPVSFHVEICEDVWVPEPPSSLASMAGAEVLLNLSASNITIGKAEARRLLCASQSARCAAVYAYSAAGPGESTTDLAWDGHASIFELGALLTETERFALDSTLAIADVDLGRVRQERARTGSLGDNAAAARERVSGFRTIEFTLDAPTEPLELIRKLERFPYVPSDPARLAEDCYEAYNIQVQGLAKRLASAKLDKLVIGISGGLDSTQALIVATRAMARLGLPASNILAYTLPGFATSEATKAHAHALMKALGVTAGEIDIRPAARQMLADLGHPFASGQPVYDVTFENVQAGLRTDYLFRLANQHGALVVGTGDLSELGLGWCTYGVGDHMSHYNPNASVSKTLIQHLIRFVAASGDVGDETATLLLAILDFEITPELVPAGEDGAVQSTEAFVGPYALQDFNLYYLTRFGFRPSKIAYLAWNAWRDASQGRWPAHIPEAARRAYDLAEIKRWMRLFLVRFFANQFKRSCVPNAPKISSGGSLSPRGDWRAPSDAPAEVWIEELEAHTPDRVPR
ncbi:MAG TPA: NAD(+) synthase [Caulobacteraceae bacterium]|jgi:NAD+ synthase (glutamine-hydrolysing)|nr:NAD(+) synthase [Caulobacteraceae bacterium]